MQNTMVEKKKSCAKIFVKVNQLFRELGVTSFLHFNEQIRVSWNFYQMI